MHSEQEGGLRGGCCLLYPLGSHEFVFVIYGLVVRYGVDEQHSPKIYCRRGWRELLAAPKDLLAIRVTEP